MELPSAFSAPLRDESSFVAPRKNRDWLAKEMQKLATVSDVELKAMVEALPAKREALERELDGILQDSRDEEERALVLKGRKRLEKFNRYEEALRTRAGLPPVDKIVYEGLAIHRIVPADSTDDRLNSVLEDIESERALLEQLDEEQNGSDYEFDLGYELDGYTTQPGGYLFAGEKLEHLKEFENAIIGLLENRQANKRKTAPRSMVAREQPQRKKSNVARRTGILRNPNLARRTGALIPFQADTEEELQRKRNVYYLEHGSEPPQGTDPWEAAARFLQRPPVPLPVPPRYS